MLVFFLLLALHFSMTVGWSGSTSAGSTSTIDINVRSLSMRVRQVYFKFSPSSGACALISKKSKFDVRLSSCGKLTDVHSGNIDYTAGTQFAVDARLRCTSSSKWYLEFRNNNTNCKTNWEIRLPSWECDSAGPNKANECLLRYRTIPHKQNGPVVVGTVVKSTIEVLDDPYSSNNLLVGLSSSLLFNSITPFPIAITSKGTTTLESTITTSSVGMTDFCVDVNGPALSQYYNLGTGCKPIEVYGLTNAPPTLVPTLIPTDLPTIVPTDVPPTAVPTNIPTAVPTLVPTTIPTTIPTLIPTSIPTTIPRTAQPTLIPTSVPLTQIPITSKPAVPDSLGTGDAGGGVSFTASVGSLVAGSGAGGALSKTMVIANQIKCTDGVPSDGLPFIVHPLIFAIKGNYWAGAVIGNISLCLFSYIFLYLFVFIMKRRNPDKDITLTMRYPGVLIPASLILYPSILQYSGLLLIYSHTAVMKIVGVSGISFCIIFMALVMTIFRCNHNKCAYRQRSEEHYTPFVAYALGCGAWEAVDEDDYYVERMGTGFDIYCYIKHLRGHYIVIEYGPVPLLVGAAWISTNNVWYCTVRISVLFFATFVQLIYVWKFRVYIAPLLTHLHVLTNSLISSALLLELVSIHAYGESDNWADSISTNLMTASVSLVLLRCAYDCLQYVVDIVSGYKRLIIQESHNDSPQFEKENVSCTSASDMMMPLMPLSNRHSSEASSQPNLAFVNMEYNLLHCKFGDSDNEGCEVIPFHNIQPVDDMLSGFIKTSL